MGESRGGLKTEEARPYVSWSEGIKCELVQGCIEKGQSQKGDSRQRKLSGTIQNLRKLSG